MACATKSLINCGNYLLVCFYKPEGNIAGHALIKDWNYEAIRNWGEDFETCNE